MTLFFESKLNNFKEFFKRIKDCHLEIGPKNIAITLKKFSK